MSLESFREKLLDAPLPAQIGVGALSGAGMGAGVSLLGNAAVHAINKKFKLSLSPDTPKDILWNILAAGTGGAMGTPIALHLAKRRREETKTGSDSMTPYEQGYFNVLEKFAEIAYEDVARGVAGKRQREDIAPEDVEAMRQQAYDTTYEGGKRAPLIGGGIGAATGGVLGGLAGGPGGAAIGAGVGGAAGAGLGQLGRWSNAKGEESFAQSAGETARQGRIPYEISESELARLIRAYTQESQDDLVGDFSPEEYYEEADRQQKRLALEQGLAGALTGNLLSGSDGGWGEARDTLVGAGGGALSGMVEGRQRAGQQVDLRERGYGHAADMLQRRGMSY